MSRSALLGVDWVGDNDGWRRGMSIRPIVLVAMVLVMTACGDTDTDTNTESTVTEPLTTTTEPPTTVASTGTPKTTTSSTTTTAAPPITAPSTTSSTSATTTTTRPTTTTVTTTTLPAEYVSVLPDGLTCADFTTLELGWGAAVGYWFVNGRPSRLDADGDGLPCEHTEFPLDLPACCGETPPDSKVPGHLLDEWGAIPHGWFCRDVIEVFGDYAEALQYWIWDGEPARMDADRDGYPCETVYPDHVIRDTLEDPSLIRWDFWNMTTADAPSGLRCKDAISWFPFYQQVLGYYFAEGLPGRMDADRNGIPCETVYEDARFFGESARGLAPGLTCADFTTGEYPSYYAVIEYYLVHGQPAELDPDGDGYPCSPGWPYPEDVEYFKDGSPGCCAG